jgi:hypothetical protein
MRTTGHRSRVASILKGRTKQSLSTKPPKTAENDRQERKRRAAKRRREGYDWLFE